MTKRVESRYVKCPVCNMGVTNAAISAEHLGVRYAFCSEPCRNNFLRRPKLYVGRAALAKQGKVVMKHRRFQLEKVVAGLQHERLQFALKQLMSVEDISIDGCTISMTYNLLEINARQIESALRDAGMQLSNSWWQRLKRNWIHYTEENELDNLTTAASACCNRPPAKG